MVVLPSLERTSSVASAILFLCAVALPIQGAAALQIPDNRFASAETDALFGVTFTSTAGLIPSNSYAGASYFSSGRSHPFPVTHLDGAAWILNEPSEDMSRGTVLAGMNNYGHTYGPPAHDPWAGVYQEWNFAPIELALLVNTGPAGAWVQMDLWTTVRAYYGFEGPGIGWVQLGFQIRADAPGGELFDHSFHWAAEDHTADNPFDTAYHGWSARDDFTFRRAIWLEPGESIRVSVPEYTSALAIELWPQAQAVPEPATWSMLIMGFGLAGMSLRKRRRVPV